MDIDNYARKHNPFISFKNIQKDKKRCANIVSAKQLDKDIDNDSVPQYVFYTPDVSNKHHSFRNTFAHCLYRSTMMLMTSHCPMAPSGSKSSLMLVSRSLLLAKRPCLLLLLMKMTAIQRRTMCIHPFSVLISSSLPKRMTKSMIIIRSCVPLKIT